MRLARRPRIECRQPAYEGNPASRQESSRPAFRQVRLGATPAAPSRCSQRGCDRGERAAEARANGGHRADDDDGDEGGYKAVFDGGNAGFIAAEPNYKIA